MSVVPLGLLVISFLISFAAKIGFHTKTGGVSGNGQKVDYKL